MGFPAGYTELFLPNFFLHILSFLGFIRSFIFTLFYFLGLSDFLDPTDTGVWYSESWTSTSAAYQTPASVLLMREFLPVISFEDIDGDKPDSCAVCLYEFEGRDEIRSLPNCKHVFHRGCVDRWMNHDQKTCPLCRTAFLPEEDSEEYNKRLWAATVEESSELEMELHREYYSDYIF